MFAKRVMHDWWNQSTTPKHVPATNHKWTCMWHRKGCEFGEGKHLSHCQRGPSLHPLACQQLSASSNFATSSSIRLFLNQPDLPFSHHPSPRRIFSRPQSFQFSFRVLGVLPPFLSRFPVLLSTTTFPLLSFFHKAFRVCPSAAGRLSHIPHLGVLCFAACTC